MKAAMFVPDAAFGLADADAVLGELKDVDGGGLASSEEIQGKGGQPPRLFMSTRQTLNMLVRAARSTVSDDERDAEVAHAAERLLTTGPFKAPVFVEADPDRAPQEVLETAGIDNARTTRLVILDPRQFSLLNGIDQDTRAAVRSALGLGPDQMPVQWASSAVFGIVNTQRRSLARGAAVTFLAWDRVAVMEDVKADPELAEKAKSERIDARRNLETAIKRAYQHIVYLAQGDEAQGEARVDRSITFEQDNQTALDGTTVWKALFDVGKVFEVGAFSSQALTHNLRDDDYGRPLDEVRDLFWNAPRMPLLPGGESDLQRAIFDAVTAGTMQLVGTDGYERTVTNAGEIGVGQANLRLAKPGPAESGAEGGEPAISHPTTPQPTIPQPIATSQEKQLAFTLRTSLSGEAQREALYSLLSALGRNVDEGNASYAEVMVRMRLDPNAADEIAQKARDAGTTPSVTDAG